MTTEWRKDICNEKSGFLFNHPCDRLPRSACGRCQKPICGDHAHMVEGESTMICTTCTKEAKRINRKTQRRRGYYDGDFNDDPYFYGPRYGRHWHRRRHRDHGHDPNDFTEADGESFQRLGDDDFENDMSES